MADSKRPAQAEKAAWSETKAAVHKYAKNPCAATEQAVSEALHKVRDLSTSPPAVKKPGKAEPRE